MKLICLLLVLPFCLFAQTTVEKLCNGMKDLNPQVKTHLQDALKEIVKTDTGKFLLQHVSPDLRFQTKAMTALGNANTKDVITLEALRLKESDFINNNPNLLRAKICFTAEILTHEMLHNAQFHAGLFAYPPNCSGLEASLCEKLLELQAKYTGEKMFHDLRQLPAYQSLQAKPGLFLVAQRQAEEPEKMYIQTLWCNLYKTSEGKPLYRDQRREVNQWNLAYTEQAFRNNYRLFRENRKGSGSKAIADHLAKIIRFTKMPVTAEFLLKKAPNAAIQNGISCHENGKKILELEANTQGYEKRILGNGTVRKTQYRFTAPVSF